jgi:hypothetical protein
MTQPADQQPSDEDAALSDDAPGDAVPEDEASRESFPASDPPSSWSGEEYGLPDPPATAGDPAS